MRINDYAHPKPLYRVHLKKFDFFYSLAKLEMILKFESFPCIVLKRVDSMN
jgi:hypothetical protein